MMITSLQNPKIKWVLSLRKRNERDESGLFLIEGFRELSRAAHKVKIESLFLCKEFFMKENEESLLNQFKEVFPFYCTPQVFEKISYRDRPDGWIAVAKKEEKRLENLQFDFSQKDPFFLVAESIEKPGNLGTILRSCDGVGVDAMFLCDPCTDLFNPNVVRSSVGTLFSEQVIQCTKEELIPFLQQKKVKIIASSPQASLLYSEIDYNGAIAIIVGTEQYGLSEKWLSEADQIVKIPMLGIADSLNVSTATTLLLYEALRQRSNSRL